MDLGALLLLAALAIVVGLYVFSPYAENTSRLVTAREHDISALMAERDSVLNTLQELEMDYLLGKIPEEDYPRQRAALMQAGVEILKKLDAITGDAGDISAAQRMETVADEARAQAAAAAESENADDLEALIARRRAQRRSRSAGFCPQCGRAVLKKDKFCAHCGYILKS